MALGVQLAGNPYTINGIATVVKDGSISADLSLTADSHSTITFYCNFTDAGNLENYLLTANNFLIAGYSCMHGAAHPIYTGHYCYNIRAIPVEPPTDKLTYRYMELQCEYRPWVFDPGSPILITSYSYEPCGMVLTVPPTSSAAGYTVSGTAINNASPVQNTFYIPLYRYSVTIYNVLTLPLSTINSRIRTSNNASFTIKLGGGNTLSIPKGCAVYEGIAQTQQTVTTAGAGRYNITHQWTISTIDQNKVPNWDLFTGSITDVLNTVMVLPDQLKYPYADHSTLGV